MKKVPPRMKIVNSVGEFQVYARFEYGHRFVSCSENEFAGTILVRLYRETKLLLHRQPTFYIVKKFISFDEKNYEA